MNMTKELFAGVAACCMGASCIIGMGGLYFASKWLDTKAVESSMYLSGLIAMGVLMGLVAIAAVVAAVGTVLCEIRDLLKRNGNSNGKPPLRSL